MNKSTPCFLLAVAFLSNGCASTEKILRSEPSVFMNTQLQTKLDLPPEIEGALVLRCVRTRNVKFADRANKAPGSDKECLYITADMSGLTKVLEHVDQANRDKLVSVLLMVSDGNCNTWLARAFANKVGLDTTKGFIQDIATGLSAATANSIPGVSAGLDIANLIADKSVTGIDTNYYLKGTFQAMESAILSERILLRTDIRNNLSQTTDTYSIFDAIGDIYAYDRACSIEGGLLKLSELANTEKTKAETAKTDADKKNNLKIETNNPDGKK